MRQPQAFGKRKETPGHGIRGDGRCPRAAGVIQEAFAKRSETCSQLTTFHQAVT